MTFKPGTLARRKLSAGRAYTFAVTGEKPAFGIVEGRVITAGDNYALQPGMMVGVPKESVEAIWSPGDYFERLQDNGEVDYIGEITERTEWSEFGAYNCKMVESVTNTRYVRGAEIAPPLRCMRKIADGETRALDLLRRAIKAEKERDRAQAKADRLLDENIRLKAAVASTQTHLGNLVRDIHNGR
jgi:hypothetical protein